MSVVIVKTSEPESIEEIMKIAPAYEICDTANKVSRQQLVAMLAMEIDCWCAMNGGCYSEIMEALSDAVARVNE